MARSAAECHSRKGSGRNGRWFMQQIGNQGEIGFGFDFGAKGNGELVPKILIGAGVADGGRTDDSRSLFVLQFRRLLGLLQFSL